MIPVRCDSPKCDGCRHRILDRRSAALAFARPDRYLVLTGVPDTYVKFSAMRKRMDEILTRAGYDTGEWAITIEINPRGTGNHANVLRHSGDPLPHRRLSEAASRAGFAPHVYDEPVRAPEAVSRYMLKDAVDPRQVSAFRAANGRQWSHHSPDYFRDEDGLTLDCRAAESLAYPPARTGLISYTSGLGADPSPDPDLSPLDALRLSDAAFNAWMLRQSRSHPSTGPCTAPA